MNEGQRLCACGCGGQTPLAKRTRSDIGHVKGEPTRFIQGHSSLPRSAAERFWPKVEKGSGCWNWTGAITDVGYGSFYLGAANGGKNGLAHRWAYENAIGPIPAGMQLDHLCRNRRCVRPAHLEVVTQRVNLLRGMAPTIVSWRTNTCKRGHKFTPENTAWQGPGKRYRACRTCRAARQRGVVA